MNPSPKVITGPLHPDNKGACDWGYQGFLAYGCHGYIVIVDTKTLQIIQTIGPMKDNVTHIRWTREKYHHAFATGSTYSLILAAADMTGSICVWDVLNGQIRTEFTECGKSILSMEWYVGHDASHDLLAVLRSPDTLELWDGYSGMCMWQKKMGDVSRSFAIDPFDIERVVVLCDSPRLLVLSDITPHKGPSDNITYIQFTDPSPSITGDKRKGSSSSERLLHRTSQSWTKMATLASSIIMNSPEPANKRQSVSEEDTDIVTSCLQAVFNRVHRHFLILLFPTELQVIDLEVELVVGVIRLDKSSPNFVKVVPFQFVDMILCLHENGSASLRTKRQTKKNTEMNDSIVAMDTTYDLCCQSDALRLMRQSKVYNFVYQPVTERQACIVISDSKVILLDLMKISYSQTSLDETIPPLSLGDLVRGQTIINRKGGKPGEINLKLIVSGLLSGIVSPAKSVAMAPSTASSKEASTVLALGSGSGTIQLVNVHSGQVEKEFKVFMSPVRHLEWLGASRILTYSYPDPPSYGNKLVKNEVILINIHTGCVSTLRESKTKEGPILYLKASPSRKFFAILIQDKCIELWDIAKKQMNAEVNLHIISSPSSMSWYPNASRVKRTVTSTDDEGEQVTKKEKLCICEQLFVVAQTDMGNLVKLNIMDGYVSDKMYFKNQVVFGAQNVKTDFILVEWKKAFGVIADRNGPVYLTYGHQKSKTKKFFDGHGTPALKIMFGPGADNYHFFILYPDELDIWNFVNDKVELVATSPSIKSAIKDAVWTGPESVVILSEDSCLHVMVVRHKKPSTPVIDDGFLHIHEAVLMSIPSHITYWKLKDIFSPALYEPKPVFNLKYSLQCNIEPFNHRFEGLLPNQDRAFYIFIREKSISTADRCYMVARLFGDEYDMEFWRLFNYRISNCKPDGVKLTSSVTKPLDLQEWFSQTVLVDRGQDNLINLSSENLDTKGQQEIGDMDLSWLQNIESELEDVTGLDVFMNAADYKAKELSRLGLWNKRRYDYRVKQLCTSRWIQIDKHEMAVAGLMETDMENPNFKSDFFKACLTSCIGTTNTSLSMIKLASTHLIAGGHTEDGVELLCLINKRLDACKYLIANGQWKNAVWLAKTSLTERECLDIICKWTEHLWNNCEQKSKALLLMLSMGQFTTVLRMLCDLRQFDTAAMFLQACQEHGVISPSQYTNCVFLEFAKILAMTEYQSAVEYYCHLAGEIGEQLLEDLKRIPTHHHLG